jgi:hypothetical protein
MFMDEAEQELVEFPRFVSPETQLESADYLALPKKSSRRKQRSFCGGAQNDLLKTMR